MFKSSMEIFILLNRIVVFNIFLIWNLENKRKLLLNNNVLKKFLQRSPRIEPYYIIIDLKLRKLIAKTPMVIQCSIQYYFYIFPSEYLQIQPVNQSNIFLFSPSQYDTTSLFQYNQQNSLNLQPQHALVNSQQPPQFHENEFKIEEAVAIKKL